MRYFLVFFAVLCFFMASFGLIMWLDVPLLTDPSYLLDKGGIVAALVSVGLLAGDIVLPVPSSLLMIANGALFGVALGTALSMLGGLMSTFIGFYIGRKGDKLINRFVKEKERERAEAIIRKWGLLALIVTRPVPLLAETVSIMAGSAGISGKQVFWTSVLGYLPGAFLYALTGASALTIESGLISFSVVIGIAFLFWLIGYLMRPKTEEEAITNQDQK